MSPKIYFCGKAERHSVKLGGEAVTQGKFTLDLLQMFWDKG